MLVTSKKWKLNECYQQKSTTYKLAQAALEYAIYFLELNAYKKVISYLNYAAEQTQSIATEENALMTISQQHSLLEKHLHLMITFFQIQLQTSHK